MKTENEIKALPLEEKQKLVIELRSVKPGDKGYPNAKAIIELITSEKKWKEPEPVEVKNVAGHEINVDGNSIAADGTGKVFPWQLAALARFLEPVTKAAALLLFVFGLLFGAQAQTQTYLVGGPGQYNVVSIAGLNGGTNYIAGTNTFTTGVITTNATVTPNWNYTNGVAYNSPTTNYTYTTNVPGLLNVANYDALDIQWGSALTGAGNSNATLTVDTSDDGTTFVPAVYTLTNTGNGTAMVSGHLAITGLSAGWLRFNTWAIPSGTPTNAYIHVARKPQRTGP